MNDFELVLDTTLETGTIVEDVDEKVRQTPNSQNKYYEVLLSGSDDNTEHIEGSYKNDGMTYNPALGNLRIIKINGVTVGNDPKFTDTTYDDATQSTHGLMSANDKHKLDTIEEGAEVNVVTSVANKTGNVTLSKSDVGLGSVDNTSDKDKPISDATQSALDDKVDKITGKGLSENDFTNGLKEKLDNISYGAEVNQNAFSNVKKGNVTISANSKTDTIELIEGNNVSIALANKTVTISAVDTTYSPADTAPPDINTTGAVGSSTDYAREDHTHKISVETGDNDGQVKIAGANATVKGLGSSAFKNVTNAYSSSGTDPVSGQAVAQAIDEIPNPMVFKGSLGVGGTITALPIDGSANVGDTYKVITDGTYAGQSAEIGDIFICKTKTNDSNTWERIPSGDEPSGTVTSIKLQATTPIIVDDDSAITTSGTRTFSHANSGVTAGSYGDTTGQTPAFGGTFKVPSATVNATGHITEMAEHTVTIPNDEATTETAGLMSSTDKSKINGIEAEANKTVVDNALDGTSANPVENRVVKSALDEKLNADETAVNSNGLVVATPITDTAPYIYRETPVKESFKALMHKIVGASVVWNQLVKNGNFVDTSNWTSSTTSTFTVSNNIATFKATQRYANLAQTIVDITKNHKCIAIATARSYSNLSAEIIVREVANSTTIQNVRSTLKTDFKKFILFINIISDVAEVRLIFQDANTSDFGDINIKNVMFADLTAMFGTTIADYVYALEQATAGSGIAWLQSYGFFTEDYYAYKQNRLESGCVSEHKTYGGETLLTNTELSPITLRGLFGLDNGKLTIDGDEYNADGSVNRKYGILNLVGGSEVTYNPNGHTSGTQRCAISLPNKKYGSSNFISDKFITTGVETLFTAWGRTNSANVEFFLPDDLENTSASIKGWFASNPTTIIYELETPTTEQTTPFTETEIVGDAEEFVDYGVSQNTRDVAIPVGTETDYYQEMKLPSLPTTSGNHNLIYNPSTGFGWS